MSVLGSQNDLPLFQCTRDDANVIRFVELVDRSGNWCLAAEVLEKLQLEVSEAGRRTVRAWAEMSDTVISGQKGYCHINNATAEEIHHCCSWMDHQGDKMKMRAARIRQRAHAKLG